MQFHNIGVLWRSDPEKKHKLSGNLDLKVWTGKDGITRDPRKALMDELMKGTERVRVMVFPNEKKAENHPDFRLVLAIDDEEAKVAPAPEVAADSITF